MPARDCCALGRVRSVRSVLLLCVSFVRAFVCVSFVRVGLCVFLRA